MKEKGILIIILSSLVILLTLIDLGMYTTNRLLVKNQQQRLAQIQAQIVNRDKLVQQFIGQLKASKTLADVKEVLNQVQ